MITIDDVELVVNHFPDGTQKINLSEDFEWCTKIHFIDWFYQKEEECMTLWMLVKHIRDNEPFESEIWLTMPYVPNARQDRTYTETEVFTLKYFCDFINSLNFTKVRIMDVHSNVTPALLNRVCLMPIDVVLKKVLNGLDKENLIIYYPDEGSIKRYVKDPSFNILNKFPYLIGDKTRVWETRKITDLKILKPDHSNAEENDLKGKDVLMIDDIITRGGTMALSAKKLKSLGASKIFAYATHTENGALNKKDSKLIGLLEDGTIEKVFTTNTIFTSEHDKIEVISFDCYEKS